MKFELRHQSQNALQTERFWSLPTIKVQIAQKGFNEVTTDNLTTCADINECTEKTHDCDAYSVCENSLSSFSCKCEFTYFRKHLTMKLFKIFKNEIT